MNGPEQGVATNAASAPVANDPIAPERPAKAGVGSSNSPARLNAIPATSSSNMPITRGS